MLILSLSTNLPTLYFFLSGRLSITYHGGLPVRVKTSLYSDLFSFIVILALLSLPLSRSLSQFASGTVAKPLLNTLGSTQSILHTLPPTYTLV